jgi:F-type H+-transporting ATPase subunit b
MRIRALLAALLLALAALVALPAAVSAQEEGDGTQPGAESEEAEEAELTHEAEECIHILEDGGTVDECQEAPSPILPETNEIIWGGLAFLIILGALWKFGLPAVTKAMDARTERIRSSLDEAEKAKTDAEAVRADYQRQLAEARGEAARIVEEARQQADAVRRDLTQRAEADAQDLRRRNAEQLEAERARVLGELRGQVAVLAVDAAERVVRANLDTDANRRLVEEYITSLSASGVNGGRG